MKDILQILASFILGLFAQWLFYKYQKRSEANERPKIVIGRIIKAGQTLIEIRNMGKDSLTEIVVQVEWVQHEQSGQRILMEFFTPDQDVSSGQPSLIEMLGISERFFVRGLPVWSDSGLVRVTVSGIGVHSHVAYEAEADIQVNAGE